MKSQDFVKLEQRVALVNSFQENRTKKSNILRRINKSHGTKGGSKYHNRIRGKLSIIEKELKRIKTKMILAGIDTEGLK